MTVDELKSAERIDTRDIIEAAEELRDEVVGMRGLSDDELSLLEFHDSKGDDMAEYEDGACMIRDDCFEDYARELAEDIGAIPDDSAWPLTCIDWYEAAEQLKQDYTSVTFLHDEYLVRA